MSATESLRRHWPEYLIEGVGLGVFMMAAGVFGTLLEYSGSPVRQSIEDPLVRRTLMGIAMGLTAMAIIYSPWGRQSGAHINPAVTLTFLRLGKIRIWDAVFYVSAQFIGGIAGVWLVAELLGVRFAQPPVMYVATAPGPAGAGVAFALESVMAFCLMLAILFASNNAKLSPYTGILAGCLVALFIAIEAPYSGMSVNPARTVASAVPSGVYTAMWIYFTAPVLGMLGSAEAYRAISRAEHVHCAKLCHNTHRRCIFHCRHDHLSGAASTECEQA